jgi:hypothetical protein
MLITPTFNTVLLVTNKPQKMTKNHLSLIKNSQEIIATPQEHKLVVILSILLHLALVKVLSACTKKHISKRGLISAKTA